MYDFFSADGRHDERSRQQIIKEIISSEETHLQDLFSVVESFIEPLRAVMTEEDEKLLFVNWPQLIVCSTKLVQAFRVRDTMSQERNTVLFIADVLCEKVSYFILLKTSNFFIKYFIVFFLFFLFL